MSKAFAKSVKHLVNTKANTTSILPLCGDTTASAEAPLCTASKWDTNFPAVIVADLIAMIGKQNSLPFNYLSTNSTQDIYSYSFNRTILEERNRILCDKACQYESCSPTNDFCLDGYDIMPLHTKDLTTNTNEQQVCINFEDDLVKCYKINIFDTLDASKANYSYLYEIYHGPLNMTDTFVLELDRDLSLVQSTKFSKVQKDIGTHTITTCVISYIYDILNDNELALLSFNFTLIFGVVILVTITLGFSIIQRWSKQTKYRL